MIDIEVAHSTPSPTIDPSVHTVLIGHSMGGIVAAETLLALSNEQPLPAPTSTLSNPDAPNFASNTTLNSATGTSRPNPPSDRRNVHHLYSPTSEHAPLSPPSFMFPHIQGLLAFDTPFLGIDPGVIAHGAEGHYKTASSAYSAFSEIATGLGFGKGGPASRSDPSLATSTKKAVGALPAPTSSAADAAAAPKWQSWGKYAMFAGAAGAVAAGGAAALYSQREKISAGFGWATSHLEFVGCLGRPEELRKRFERIGQVSDEREVGTGIFYTALGKGANTGYGIVSAGEVLKKGGSESGKNGGVERTFVSLPRKIREEGESKAKGKGKDPEKGVKWYRALNDKAKDETLAHMSMFFPRENPGFYRLGERAKDVIAAWVDKGWYGTSEERTDRNSADGGMTHGEVGEGWEKPDYDAEDVKAKQREKRESGMSGAPAPPAAEHDWEGLDGAKDWREYEDEDVKMTDEAAAAGENKENLGDSIIVDHASPRSKRTSTTSLSTTSPSKSKAKPKDKETETRSSTKQPKSPSKEQRPPKRSS